MNTVPRNAAIMAWIVCALIILPVRPTSAAFSPPVVPASALSHIRAIGVTGGALPAYVETSSGLYRSDSPTLSSWEFQSSITDITAISPNPRQPDKLLYTTSRGIYRSTNGGRSGTKVRSLDERNQLGGPLFRSSKAPSMIYAMDDYDVYRSTNEGSTWTTVYTYTPGYDTYERLSAGAIDPTNPARFLIGYIGPHLAGELVETDDGGRTWQYSLPCLVAYMSPLAVAISPINTSDVWTFCVYETGGSDSDWGQLMEGGAQIAEGLPQDNLGFTPFGHAILFDPLTGRVYIDAAGRIYVFDRKSSAFAPLHTARRIDYISAITRSGYILAVDEQGQLVVIKLIGAKNI